MQLENERAVEIAELLRAKALSLTGNISRDGSAGISANVLTPPQLLVEGVDPNQQENAVPPVMLPSSSELMNTHPFQNLLFSFLDTQAPVLGMTLFLSVFLAGGGITVWVWPMKLLQY